MKTLVVKDTEEEIVGDLKIPSAALFSDVYNVRSILGGSPNRKIARGRTELISNAFFLNFNSTNKWSLAYNI